MKESARPPIVAVMGHIDHGKSSLLDYIRKSNVTEQEAGGITQHVSAYVATHDYEGTSRRITFLDTPGHEAFRALRARGAKAADVAILVIAADEGVKPQTKEAFSEITETGIPFVVAFTKIDKNGADVERGKVSALEAGIYLEGLGGSVPFVAVSSKSGAGVPELLDLVLLTSDLAGLVAHGARDASGFVLESSQDPKRGITATLIIKDGTLVSGTVVIAGESFAPVRFIEDFSGKRIEKGNPSDPVSISGWNMLPQAGETFVSVASKKEAEVRARAAREEKNAPRGLAQIKSEGKTVVPIVLKADVTGSIEAITTLLQEITHERVILRVVASGVGSVSETDVKTAVAGGAIIVAFHTQTEAPAAELAERTKVPIESFDIIYELKERVEALLVERAPRMRVEEVLGEMKVLKSFSVSGAKQVLGARHMSGTLSVGNQVKIMRRTIELDRGKILNLQVARADVDEIHVEGEFGLQVESKTEIAAGDVLTAFRVVET